MIQSTMSLFVTNKLVITFFCFLFSTLALSCPLFGKTKNLPDPKNPLQESINFIEKICGDRKLVRNERFYLMFYLWIKYFNENNKVPHFTSLDSIIEFSKMVCHSAPPKDLQKFELQMSLGFYPYLFLSEESEEQ